MSSRQQPTGTQPTATRRAGSARHAQLIAAACRRIEAAEETPDLATLAQGAGLSRFHFHRLFKEVTGLTPKAYARAHRARRMQQQLARGARVTDAVYAAGYGSQSPFYATAARDLGMQPAGLKGTS